MRVLVLGGSGMLGHKVTQVLSGSLETFATVRHAIHRPGYIIGNVNAMDFESVRRAVKWVAPKAIVNCIGIIKQVPAAKNALVSIHVNSLFPHQLAALSIAGGIRLFHISTDCVFSGRKGNYTESDISDAEDLYGRTKFLGEVDRPGCLTIRTSIIGRTTKRIGLLEWFLGNRGGRVQGYTNAIYSGFTTLALARIIRDLITDYPSLSGLYHISSNPISKYDLLVKIHDAMKLDIEIEPESNFYCDRSLDCSRFQMQTRYPIPAWDEMITGLLHDA
jgi:dTDP-4-dehydrorhamnose reductase